MQSQIKLVTVAMKFFVLIEILRFKAILGVIYSKEYHANGC